jgi:hypothetical protein
MARFGRRLICQTCLASLSVVRAACWARPSCACCPMPDVALFLFLAIFATQRRSASRLRKRRQLMWYTQRR